MENSLRKLRRHTARWGMTCTSWQILFEWKCPDTSALWSLDWGGSLITTHWEWRGSTPYQEYLNHSKCVREHWWCILHEWRSHYPARLHSKAVVSDAVKGKKHTALKEPPTPQAPNTICFPYIVGVKKKKKKKEWCWWHCNHLTNETIKTIPSCSGDKVLLNSHIQQEKNSCNFWTIYQHWTFGLFVLWKMGLDNLLAFEFVTQWACLWIFVFVYWTNFSTIGVKCNPF